MRKKNKIIIGKTYGVLKVLEVCKNKPYYYKCKCMVCNEIVDVRSDHIIDKGKTIKCNCKRVSTKPPKERLKYDLTGKKYGNLTALEYKGRRGRQSIWYCRCKCGKIVEVDAYNLRKKRVTQCKECGNKASAEKNTKRVEGKRYGNCIALYLDEEETKRRKSRSKIWRCKCDCGKEFYAPITRLENKTVTACTACLINNNSMTKGLYKTSFYESWRHMIRRCTSPNDIMYKYYGARGIKVCDKWLDFNGFKEDMYDSYVEYLNNHDTATIERINVNKGYYLENCRWATKEEQHYNKSNNIKYNVNGYGPLTLGEIFGRGISDNGISIFDMKKAVDAGVDINEAIRDPNRANARKMISFDNSLKKSDEETHIPKFTIREDDEDENE